MPGFSFLRRAAAAALLLAAAAAAAAPPALARHGRDTPVPILMYHVVAAPPPRAPFPGLYVQAADFAAQMRWLARHGFHAVTLRQVYDAWRGAGSLPRAPVVLSFDDGYRSDYTNALPVLRALRWPGVLNLELANLKPSWGVRPRMVRAMIAAGWEVDAHTLTHPDLTRVDGVRLRDEVAGSRAAIRREFGAPADFFAYPSGRYDARVVSAVRAAGYLAAATTRYGLADPRGNLFTLARIRIDGADGVRGFAAKLSAIARATSQR